MDPDTKIILLKCFSSKVGSKIGIVKQEQNPQLNMWILNNIPISSSHVTLNAYINVYSTIIQFFIFHIHVSSFTMDL